MDAPTIEYASAALLIGALVTGAAFGFLLAALSARLRARRDKRRRARLRESRVRPGVARPPAPAPPTPTAMRSDINASEPTSFPGSPAAGPEAAEAAEAQALFDFFEERFAVAERRADAVIAHMSSVAEAITRLQARRRAAENRAVALDEALNRAAYSSVDGLGNARQGGPVPGAAAFGDSAAAAWRLINDGARIARLASSALKSEHGATVAAEFSALNALIGLDGALNAVLRAEAQRRAEAAGPGLDATVMDEDWPHALWRAEAALTGYYPASGDWGDLRHGVGLIGAALRQLFINEGVATLQLAFPSPAPNPAASNGPLTGQSAPGTDAGAQFPALLTLPPVAARCGAMGLRVEGAGSSAPKRDGGARTGAWIIDCVRFGHVDEASGTHRPPTLIMVEGPWREGLAAESPAMAVGASPAIAATGTSNPGGDEWEQALRRLDGV